MVDFDKLLSKEEMLESINPIDIFNNLDRDEDKQYLRPDQKSILNTWYNKYRENRDVIVKLPTGQGKTLIGLLKLQASINEGKGPAMYICPNKYLVKQTINQAKSFGIKTVHFKENSTKVPREFLNSEAILVANCKKLFNGKSVFGVMGSERDIIRLGAIVIDDAHKCLEIIKESFSIIINRENGDGTKNKLYTDLINIFGKSLERQAEGTYLEILNHGIDTIMAVPFWNWSDKRKEVLGILQNNLDNLDILFVWDLLKNKINQCTCIFSGRRVEIVPRLLPLELIPSFDRVQRRIFLSATLTEDSFLVKDFGIDPDSVLNPITAEDVKYSGERLIIMPTLVNSDLKRIELVKWIVTLAEKHGNFGVVTIVPSFKLAEDWIKNNSKVTSVRDLHKDINIINSEIKNNNAKQVLTLVNEYDGVDLPGNTCRILCLDSLPSYKLLIDRYQQEIRFESKLIKRKLAQRVEQGIGRAIRGSNDWCIVVLIGNDVTDFLSEKSKRELLSEEAQLQINMCEELASELQSEKSGLDEIEKLINQCLKREEGWKNYYKSKMSKFEQKKLEKSFVDRSLLERNAEKHYQHGRVQKAVEEIQNLIKISDKSDLGWLLQLKATYLFSQNKTKSMDAQIKAHTENERLFRPEVGMDYSKITTSGNRASRIFDIIRNSESYNSLNVNLLTTLDGFNFNSSSETFELNLNELGRYLGFTTDRPEKKIGSGPDNLWQVDSNIFWVIECKNMVLEHRDTISKSEAGQISNSIAWFKNCYEHSKGISVMVHPGKSFAKDAYVSDPLWVLTEEGLEKIKENIMSFYKSFSETPIDSLNLSDVKEKLNEYSLDSNNLAKNYLTRVTEETRMKKL